MNLCDSCVLSNICKIFDFNSKHRDIVDVKIVNCREARTEESLIVKTEEQAVTNTIDFPMPKNQYNNFRSMVDENKKKEQEASSEKMECKNCGATVYSLESMTCDKCEKDVCLNCAMEDIGSGGIRFCEECWSES